MFLVPAGTQLLMPPLLSHPLPAGWATQEQQPHYGMPIHPHHHQGCPPQPCPKTNALEEEVASLRVELASAQMERDSWRAYAEEMEGERTKQRADFNEIEGQLRIDNSALARRVAAVEEEAQSALSYAAAVEEERARLEQWAGRMRKDMRQMQDKISSMSDSFDKMKIRPSAEADCSVPDSSIEEDFWAWQQEQRTGQIDDRQQISPPMSVGDEAEGEREESPVDSLLASPVDSLLASVLARAARASRECTPAEWTEDE